MRKAGRRMEESRAQLMGRKLQNTASSRPSDCARSAIVRTHEEREVTSTLETSRYALAPLEYLCPLGPCYEARIAATFRARALTSVPACFHDEGIQDEMRMHWLAPTNPPGQGS